MVIQQKRRREKQGSKGKEGKLTRKTQKGTECNYNTIQGLPVLNLKFDKALDPNHYRSEVALFHLDKPISKNYSQMPDEL